MGLRDDEKAGLSDEELEALEDVEEGGHADDNDEGEGDDAPVSVAADGDGAAGEGEGEPSASAEPAKPEGSDGAVEAEGESGDVPQPTLQPPPAALISVPEVGDYEVERGKLLDERRDLRQRHRDGDISTDEYEEQLDLLNDKIALVDRRKADHDHAVEQNAAVQRAQYQWTIEQVKKEFKSGDGIDYDSNPTLMSMWDKEVRALAAKEEHANKPAEWFLREGHKAVLSEVAKVAESLGFTKSKKPEPDGAKPKEGVKDAVKARLPSVPLKGVGSLPAASAEPVGSDEFSDLDNLGGLELEKALARMPEDRAAKYLNG